MNKSILIPALCAASVSAVTISTAASASTTISGSVSSISVNTSDPGLVLYASAIAFSPFVLTNPGDTHTANVMTIGTNENTINLSDDLTPLPVSAMFSFTSPTGAGGTITGSSSGFFRLLSSCGLIAGGCGQVDWNNPTVFNFGTGGAFSVTLTDVEFLTPGSATVKAKFKLLSNAVPEPATWAMMIIGFAAVGGALRTRAKRKVTLTYA